MTSGVTADWIRSALTPEQQAPFDRTMPNACILAGAGSGKTRTLVHLIAADLLAGVPASSIVAFTFTEKAASELLARVHLATNGKVPSEDLAGLFTGTIHSWCFQYLLQLPQYYNFESLDELQMDSLASRLYDHLGLEAAYNKRYPLGIEPFLKDLELFFNEHVALADVPSSIRPPIECFLETLSQNRLLTFGAMIRFALEHIESVGPIGGLHSLYIDEYQDVNPAQVRLARAMVGPDARVIGVGDDLQCIYNWRGSDVTRIIDFESDFVDSSIHRLSTNFRSRPAIVDVANAVAQDIALRDTTKTLVSGRPPDPGPNLCWVSTSSEETQADTIVEIVSRCHSTGVRWNQMAILLRSVRNWGQPIVAALTTAGIPVYCPVLARGGAFVNDLLLPLFDWLRTPHEEPRNEQEEADIAKAAIDLWEKVKQWTDPAYPEEQFWIAIDAWLTRIEEKKNQAYNVRSQLYDLMEACGIRVASDDPNLMVGIGVASQIIRSVEEIHRRRLSGQSRRTPRGLMNEVYHALKRKQQEFGESAPVETVGDAVLLTTVHQAKGLEWPVVILPNLVQRRFPVSPSSHGTSFPDALAVRYGTSPDDERRLFYVAVTRAKERLFIIDPMDDDARRRSAFIDRLAARGLIANTTVGAATPNLWSPDLSSEGDDDLRPVRVGLSEALMYVECPLQYGLRRIVGVQPAVGEELGYGKGLHEVIQRRLHDDDWDSTRVEEEIEKHVHLPLASETVEANARTAIRERLRALEALGIFDRAVEPEVNVEVHGRHGVIPGIIDGVHHNDDGTVLIRDWKSSIHDNLLRRYERQLQFYTHALRSQGHAVTGAELVDVAKSAKSKSLAVHPVDVSADAVSALMRDLDASIEGIARGAFPARPSPASCSTCDMCRLCAERVIS